MEWGQQMRKHQQNARDAMYQNSNYSFERRERKTLIIDQKGFDATKTIINTKLFEPLIIDKLSDVYLESVITRGCKDKDTNIDSMAFLISIDQFNINTNIASIGSGTTIANQHSFNKLLIPNENGSTTAAQIHKAKKLNYVCSINPTKISEITGKITDMNDQTIFNTTYTPTDTRLIVEFVIIARD